MQKPELLPKYMNRFDFFFLEIFKICFNLFLFVCLFLQQAFTAIRTVFAFNGAKKEHEKYLTFWLDKLIIADWRLWII